MNIAIFASGTGSNFHAIVQDQDLRKNVKLLVCDQPGAKVIETAKEYNVPSFVFSSKDFIDKAAYEQRISEELRQKDINFIVLAGYMRIVGETLLATYEGKMINIHPSYLPDFPGKDAVGQAIRAKVKRTGVTIHYVDAGIDTGSIITQEKVAIDEGDTLQSLTEKIQRVEHRLYPKVIKQFLEAER